MKKSVIDIQPEVQTLYPTFDSLQYAIDYALTGVPVENQCDMYAYLMAYHNTLLHCVRKEGSLKD